jgi:transposase
MLRESLSPARPRAGRAQLNPGENSNGTFGEYLPGADTRSRRIGIVALARRLLIALWRFVEDGVIPEGAKLKAS